MKKIFKQLLFSLLYIFIITSTIHAETYYVRPDGGTPEQCNGTYDGSYPDFSGNKNCAFSHPFWAISPQGNNPTKMVGGDTLIIDGSNNAQYMIGYGAPNTKDTAQCHSLWTYNCYMRSIPSGTVDKPTKILGKGWDTGCTNPPQLWGTERVYQLLNLQGSSNVEIQCLDLTDHSNCTEFHGCVRDTFPRGTWASKGISASDSNNVYIENVKVRGFAHTGIKAGRLSNWTLKNVLIRGNGWVGWDGDIGANVSSNSGYIKFINSSIEYNGCSEEYPNPSSVRTCRGQTGGGYGDGLGTHATSGNWSFENTDFIANTSDGLDLLYQKSDATTTIIGGRFEHNAGNQIKTNSPTTITGALIGGDCAYFSRAGFPDTVGVDNCRAYGNALSLGCQAKPQTLSNLTVSGEGDTLILAGANCNTTIDVSNSSFKGGLQFGAGGDMVAFYYADNSNPTLKLTNVSITDTKDCNRYPESCNVTPPDICVPDGSCSAQEPSCGQSTAGVDNCGNSCTKVGEACPPDVCIPDGSCSAAEPECGQTTIGIDNCGNECTRTGEGCPEPPACTYEWCSALKPLEVGQKTEGYDNCGYYCAKFGIEVQVEVPGECPTCEVCPEPTICPECPTCEVCPEPVVCPEPETCENINLTPKQFYSISGRNNCYNAVELGCTCSVIDGNRIFVIKGQ